MTLGGLSPSVTAQFAGVPTVTGVINQAQQQAAERDLRDRGHGGTPIQIQGEGFSGQVLAPIEFNDASGSPFSIGTQYTFTVSGDTRDQHPDGVAEPGSGRRPGVHGDRLQRRPAPADELWLYPPGDPTVDSVTPSSGPAAGGTRTTIGGENLGCVLTAYFGNKQATAVSNVHRRSSTADRPRRSVPRRPPGRPARRCRSGDHGGELLHRVGSESEHGEVHLRLGRLTAVLRRLGSVTSRAGGRCTPPRPSSSVRVV